MWRTVQTFYHRLSQTQKKVFSWIFLQGIFLFGLGLTSIVGRLTGARFLNTHDTKSTWKAHQKDVTTRTMF